MVFVTKKSTKYLVVYDNCTYPPMYVISIANLFVNGVELADIVVIFKEWNVKGRRNVKVL